jgi:hypothetical protein
VAYRLRKPPGDESTGPRQLPTDSDTAPMTSTAEPVASAGKAEPDPARRAAVVAAFSSFFLGFDSLLGDRWIGAWDRLKAISPSLAGAIDAAEGTADRVAVDYMQGRASWRDFEAAVDQYGRAWKDGAEVLRRADERRCAECGRTEFVAGVRDDAGAIRCARCLSGADHLAGAQATHSDDDHT